MNNCKCEYILKDYESSDHYFEINCKNCKNKIKGSELFSGKGKDKKGYFFLCPKCGEKIYEQFSVIKCPKCKNINKKKRNIFPPLSKRR